MTTITFDTHAFIKRLTSAGMPEAQAEAVTAMVGEARDGDLAALVTRADLSTFKAELKAELAETKAELMKWMTGALGLQTVALLGGLAALLKLASS
ncbi:MAG: CCDC90 family protein [Alphaproteobacteria bacterium]